MVVKNLERFRLKDSDEWCQTVGNWINEWATVEKQQLKWLFLRKN
jgi:predicted transcriptional regulator